MALGRLAATLAVAGALAGCGGSGYEYVANRREGVYFKVPDDWRVFGNEELLDPDEAGGGRWVRGFDAARVPDPDRVFVVASETPRGFAEVRPLGAAEREDVSLVSLRKVGFGEIDPLEFAQQNPEELRILEYDDVVLDDARGTHLRVAAEDQDGVGIVIDQTVLVDDATSTRYWFTVGCTEACWDAHEDEIEEVVDSWTLETRS